MVVISIISLKRSCLALSEKRVRRVPGRMVLDLRLPIQSVSITTDVLSTNFNQGEVFNIM
jgi:hypothetical protein